MNIKRLKDSYSTNWFKPEDLGYFETPEELSDKLSDYFDSVTSNFKFTKRSAPNGYKKVRFVFTMPNDTWYKGELEFEEGDELDVWCFYFTVKNKKGFTYNTVYEEYLKKYAAVDIANQAFYLSGNINSYYDKTHNKWRQTHSW